MRPEDFATIVAVSLIGLLWLRARIGLDLTPDRIARGVWIAVGILTLMTVWGVVTLLRGDRCRWAFWRRRLRRQA